ncbi:MAG: type II toxin-antitoxin system VapC family toxin [Candidatus Heimdallarchaeota archaeon]
MICLDSDIMMAFLRGDQDAVAKIKELDPEREVVSTAINALELFVGIVAVEGVSGKRVEATREFLSTLTIFPLNTGAAERTAYILNTLKKMGTPIGLKDSLIAGIVLENNLTLVTKNIKHFERVAGLKLESW